MDTTLSDILERAESWPKEIQEQLIAFAKDLDSQYKNGVYILSPEEREAVEEGLAQFERGEFVTEEEMEKVFARYRL